MGEKIHGTITCWNSGEIGEPKELSKSVRVWTFFEGFWWFFGKSIDFRWSSRGCISAPKWSWRASEPSKSIYSSWKRVCWGRNAKIGNLEPLNRSAKMVEFPKIRSAPPYYWSDKDDFWRSEKLLVRSLHFWCLFVKKYYLSTAPQTIFEVRFSIFQVQGPDLKFINLLSKSAHFLPFDPEITVRMDSAPCSLLGSSAPERKGL